MITRRQFTASAPALVGAPAMLAGCSAGADHYEAAARRTWRRGPLQGLEGAALSEELVRCATLAPSSHNTQCWRFTARHDAITIAPDLSRRCPVVDPDDHHLFASLGCAAENLVQAARAHGLQAEVAFDAAHDLLRVALAPARAAASPLFHALTQRQCTRGEYDAKPLSNEELALLARAGSSERVRLLLLTERAAMETVLEHVVRGNTAQINHPAFVDELKAWIRFSGADAVRHADGLYGASSGNPSVPSWLGQLLFGWFFTARNENDKIARQVRSSAGIAVFVAHAADKSHWVEVGRCYERFALQAAALDIRNAFVNQPVEVPAVRAQFASFLGLGEQRPDLVVRFGRGPRLPVSLRRPVQDVLRFGDH
ncbi:MAG TPA: Tat pathway signal protein [Albitalea sp.]